jgi:molybdopterin/thiamine biosynthesis adenylyltransferase
VASTLSITMVTAIYDDAILRRDLNNGLTIYASIVALSVKTELVKANNPYGISERDLKELKASATSEILRKVSATVRQTMLRNKITH